MKEKHKIAYMECAEAFAKCSKSQRLQVGAIVVKDTSIIAEGYNGLARGVSGALEDAEGNTLPEVRHAEKNALMKLTRSHESSVGASLFITHAPCYYCAVDIVDAGIVEVYYRHTYRCDSGLSHLEQKSVKVRQI